ncbi:MAG TPA: hypothetical protein VHV29_10305 [Terriglobales bacterium]|jgi:hypothetical protein|nr:hypothetical protein [Terriglobales bacterium]
MKTQKEQIENWRLLLRATSALHENEIEQLRLQLQNEKLLSALIEAQNRVEYDNCNVTRPAYINDIQLLGLQR